MSDSWTTCGPHRKPLPCLSYQAIINFLPHISFSWLASCWLAWLALQESQVIHWKALPAGVAQRRGLTHLVPSARLLDTPQPIPLIPLKSCSTARLQSFMQHRPRVGMPGRGAVVLLNCRTRRERRSKGELKNKVMLQSTSTPHEVGLI